MSHGCLATVVVTSYNYSRFLGEAIDSALAQTYTRTEIVVVDDGSSDGSREVIAGYGRQIAPVLKANGGQASAFNAGFAHSHGEVVIFLDSDDALLPSAVATAVDLCCEPGVAKAHWPLWVVDEHGRRTGEIEESELPEGDFRIAVMRKGPMTEATLPSAPTSGNAWARAFLERVLPMPERPYRICADAYLFGLAPAFGRIRAAAEPQGLSRVHGQNAHDQTTFEERVARGMVDHEEQSRLLSRVYRDAGIEVDPPSWRANAWWPRIGLALGEIASVVPAGEPFVLVDQDAWGTDELVAGRARIPFPGRRGRYWGPPEDDEAALRELERVQGRANYIVFAWPAFWWLEHYTGLERRLRSGCLLENDRVVVYDLRR